MFSSSPFLNNRIALSYNKVLPPYTHHFLFLGSSPSKLSLRLRRLTAIPSAAMESIASQVLNSLQDTDPWSNKLGKQSGIQLIASENFTSFTVMEALGSAPALIKYFEGMSDARLSNTEGFGDT